MTSVNGSMMNARPASNPPTGSQSQRWTKRLRSSAGSEIIFAKAATVTANDIAGRATAGMCTAGLPNRACMRLPSRPL